MAGVAWMESLEVLAPWVWERKGGLLSLEEEKCTELVKSSTKFAPTKDIPLSHGLTPKFAPTPSMSILFIPLPSS